MVVVIPISFVMPTTVMIIPPLLPFSPAALPGLTQFVPPPVCMPAVVSVMLYGFVEFVLGAKRAPVAGIIGGDARQNEQETRGESRYRCYLSQR